MQTVTRRHILVTGTENPIDWDDDCERRSLLVNICKQLWNMFSEKKCTYCTVSISGNLLARDQRTVTKPCRKLPSGRIIAILFYHKALRTARQPAGSQHE